MIFIVLRNANISGKGVQVLYPYSYHLKKDVPSPRPPPFFPKDSARSLADKR